MEVCTVVSHYVCVYVRVSFCWTVLGHDAMLRVSSFLDFVWT
jgi:hypothetical protein